MSEETVSLGKGQPILVEGLHALNPALTYFVPGYQCMRVYVSALTQLTINDHNRISTSDTRLLRRLVRDVQFRGNGAEHTLEVWDSVRQGEGKISSITRTGRMSYSIQLCFTKYRFLRKWPNRFFTISGLKAELMRRRRGFWSSCGHSGSWMYRSFRIIHC